MREPVSQVLGDSSLRLANSTSGQRPCSAIDAGLKELQPHGATTGAEEYRLLIEARKTVAQRLKPSKDLAQVGSRDLDPLGWC